MLLLLHCGITGTANLVRHSCEPLPRAKRFWSAQVQSIGSSPAASWSDAKVETGLQQTSRLQADRGQHDDPVAGRQVLHFSALMSSDGISIDRVWHTMGMRGTGSRTVVLDNVFVPEKAITLRRPCGEYHPVWNVVLTFALPMFAPSMSA